MVGVYNQNLPPTVLPYITRDVYRAQPTAAETNALVRGGAQSAQDAALDRLILQASSWCDRQAMGTTGALTAQVSVETSRGEVSKEGFLRIHPRQGPVVQLLGVSWGYDPTSMTTMTDLTHIWIENDMINVPIGSGSQGSWVGSLQIGRPMASTRVNTILTYVAGYASTTLASPALATDSVLTVASSVGIAPGTQVRLLAGGAPTGAGSSQVGLVQTIVSVLSVTGNVLTLNGPVGTAFAAGAAASAMPAELDDACILAVTGIIKQGGTGGLVMRSGNSATKPPNSKPGDEEFDRACAILEFYRPANL